MIYKTVDGHTLALYVNEPAEPSAKLRAAVVFLNGGGWTGDLPQQFNQQSNTVAEHGAVGIEVKYRLLNKRDRTTPPRICVEDAKSAIRWVSSHASELKIDPNRIAAAGGSAGGYMAAYAAMVPGWDAPGEPADVSAKPDALVLFNPVLDNSPNGCGNPRFGQDDKRRSPLFFASSDVSPMLIQSGANDAFLHAAVLRMFQKRPQADHVHCDLAI